MPSESFNDVSVENPASEFEGDKSTLVFVLLTTPEFLEEEEGIDVLIPKSTKLCFELLPRVPAMPHYAVDQLQESFLKDVIRFLRNLSKRYKAIISGIVASRRDSVDLFNQLPTHLNVLHLLTIGCVDFICSILQRNVEMPENRCDVSALDSTALTIFIGCLAHQLLTA
jgi:hypothetical protein